MRIATVFFYYQPMFSGAAIGFHELAQEFVSQGHSVTVFTPRYSGLSQNETIDGICVKRLTIRGKKRLWHHLTFTLVLTLALLRYRNTYEVLHLHSFSPLDLLPVGIARLFGKKVLYQVTIMGSEPGAILRASPTAPLTWIGLRMVNGYAALTNTGLKRIIQDSYGPAVVLSYGVDTMRFSPPSADEKQALRHKLGLKVDAKLICFVGTVCERKGTDILIEAFQRIAHQQPDALLVIVGRNQFLSDVFSDAPYVRNQKFVDNLRSALMSYELQDRVIFTGLTDDVDAYLRASDLFVFPSRREGFGIVIIEAMAVGLPCIVAELDGIAADIVTPGESGYIVDSGNPDLYARYMLELLSDPKKAAQFGQCARRDVVERFSLPRVARRYISYYSDLLSSARRANA